MSNVQDPRGEVSIKIGEKEYILEPSFKKIKAVEKALDKTFVQIAADVAQKKALSFEEVATIVATFAKSEKPLLVDNVGEEVMQAGILRVFVQLQPLFTNVLTGGKEDAEGSLA